MTKKQIENTVDSKLHLESRWAEMNSSEKTIYGHVLYIIAKYEPQISSFGNAVRLQSQPTFENGKWTSGW